MTTAAVGSFFEHLESTIQAFDEMSSEERMLTVHVAAAELVELYRSIARLNREFHLVSERLPLPPAPPHPLAGHA